MVARKEIRRPEDLKGRSIGVTRPGDLSACLSRQVVRKFGLTTELYENSFVNNLEKSGFLKDLLGK